MGRLSRSLVAGFLLGAPLFASTHVVEVENFSYPSPAAVHLNLLQGEIAQKAIEVCKGKENVTGITSISIKVTKGVNDPVAQLAKETSSHHGPALDFWYPKLHATASVECND